MITIAGVIVELNLKINYSTTEIFTPRNNINKDLNSLKNIRAIQLLNWPIIKQKLIQKYPMIDSIKLSGSSFPQLKINIIEKQPWAIIINDNKQQVYSYDGTLLNPNLPDVELPSMNIMIINSNLEITNNDRITDHYLTELQQISDGLKIIPFFDLQQILLKETTTELISSRGMKVNLGKVVNTIEKFEMLKYFISNQRKDLEKIQLIDIQFPKRVIVK